MRSRMVWLVACATAVSALAACSGDDERPAPTTTDLPNLPGAGGAPAAPLTPPSTTPVATDTGSGPPEAMNPPERADADEGEAAGAGDVDAGAGEAGGSALADAGAAPEPDAGATPPGNTPDDTPENPPPANPPPADAVGFSDVFQLLVDNCGNCHGANAPGNRPRFAQAGNQAASFAATQAMSPNGGTVAARIIVRAVTQRNMPPACNGQALGTGACLDANEAAQLQAWLDQGARP